MKAHYFTAEFGGYGAMLNGYRYLFIPDKKILMTISSLVGGLNIERSSTGHFEKTETSIEWAQEIIKSNGNNEEGIKYIGKIDLPKKYCEKISSLSKEYDILETQPKKSNYNRKELNKKSYKKAKNLVDLVKEKFPESFTHEVLCSGEEIKKLL